MPFSNLSGTQIRDAVVNLNPLVTKWFFYVKCHSLLTYSLMYFFKNKIKYDDYVNTIYVYLMEDNARRFMTYDGTGDICGWMMKTVYNLSLSIIKKRTLIEDVSKEPLYNKPSDDGDSYTINFDHMDLEHLFDLLEKENKTYAYVLRRLIFEDAEPEEVAQELNTNRANIYNIKRRAQLRIVSYINPN